MTQFHPAQPQWTSLGTSDQRAAWTGVWPGTTSRCASKPPRWHGKPVFFQLISEWTKPDNMPSADSSSSKTPEVLLVIFLMIMLGGAVWLARRNYRRRRAIRRARCAWAC